MCEIGGPKKNGDPFVVLRSYQKYEAGGGISWEKTRVLAEALDTTEEYITHGEGERRQPRSARAVDTDIAERLGTIEDRLDDLHAQRNGFMVLLEQQTTILARIEEATRTLDAAGEKWANRLSTTTRRIFEEAERDVQSREEARDRRATQRSPQG
jgi:hypothetical protein